ncbi:MAG: 23S rRNA (adenine(2503)-C(2))-methyltransferase RlmN [Muribaculum sp.]|nr:23S rRNA (adenine(2503)-C(2))-methyltransferase RlmN [Muribaculum sp.]
MNKNDLQPLIGMTLQQLREVAAGCGLPGFAAKQIADWLYVKRVTSIDAMTNISLKGRERLAASYCVGRFSPKAEARSVDGTVKYLFDGKGGRDIEAVYIPDRDRATLCVSSQAGCRMGCRFCMTGRQGFHGNLTTADIINQILSIPESQSLTNIVFMGMGEPMDNLDAVLPALEILTAAWGLAWSPKRITVSTIGKIKELKTLLDTTKVHIAISVHSPLAEQRASLMPVENAYPLKDVLSLLRGYDFSHQRRLSLEYIMWGGLNDNLRYAQSLSRLLKGLDCRVNLIRFHAIPDSDLKTSDEATMTAFRDRLNDLGITATIRTSRGEDIAAACGMLAGKQNKQENDGSQAS